MRVFHFDAEPSERTDAAVATDKHEDEEKRDGEAARRRMIDRHARAFSESERP